MPSKKLKCIFGQINDFALLADDSGCHRNGSFWGIDLSEKRMLYARVTRTKCHLYSGFFSAETTGNELDVFGRMLLSNRRIDVQI